MNTYSAEAPATQAARRQTMRQITAHALRQTKRLGAGDMILIFEAGELIGTTVADIGIRRRCRGDVDFDLASLIEHVLNIDPVVQTPDQRARQAVFVGICKEVEQLLKWGYENEGFRFNFDDEGAVMTRVVRKATERTDNWRRYRESLAAA